MNPEIKNKFTFKGSNIIINHIREDTYYWASLLYVKIIWYTLDSGLHELWVIGIKPDYEEFVSSLLSKWGKQLWYKSYKGEK